MAQIIPKLRKKLDKFKTWIEWPRLYIVEELDVIKNEIDIVTERIIMRASKGKAKSEEQIKKKHEKINSNRKKMIDKVESFQKKFLANMPTNELTAEFAKTLNLSIEECEKKLQELEKELSSEKASELEYAIDSVIYEFDCELKQKSSLLFVDVFLLKKIYNSYYKSQKEQEEENARDEDAEVEYSDVSH